MSLKTPKAAIAIEASAPAVEAVLFQGLVAHAEKAGAASRKTFNVVLRNELGALCGGIVVIMNFDVLWLRLVWLDEAWRGRGHGRDLIESTEAEGQRLGARLAWVETFDWQARPFYERLGYELFAELPHDGGRRARFFLKKTL